MVLSPITLLKKVKKLEITTRGDVNHIFSGAYHSIFKGQGVEFAEVRPYLQGDDVRTIDWNVTARTGSLHVKRYREERELCMILAIDVSGSSQFGSNAQKKSALAAELAALLAFSAIKNNDRVGLLLFSDHIEQFVPPKKGRQHVLRLITEILNHQPEAVKTDLNLPLEFVTKALKRKSIVFFLSDFYADDFTSALRIARKKHDCVALILNDQREYDLPDVGWLNLMDPETGETVEINTSDQAKREKYGIYTRARAKRRLNYFATNQIDAVDLFTDRSCVKPLLTFFKKRQRQIAAMER